MRGIEILVRIGLLFAGVLGITSAAWGCDKQPKMTEATCPASNVAVAPSVTSATATPAPSPAGTVSTPVDAGMRAYLDPETGIIGGPGPLPPPSDEALNDLVPDVQAEPVETVQPDGSVLLDLKGRGQEYFILQLDADGQRVVRCVQDPNSALRTVPAPKREER